MDDTGSKLCYNTITISRRYTAMFRNLFRSDSPLMVTMTQITDCIFLSLFWLVGCLPVVTMGASFAALYDATYRFFRKGQWHRKSYLPDICWL